MGGPVWLPAHLNRLDIMQMSELYIPMLSFRVQIQAAAFVLQRPDGVLDVDFFGMCASRPFAGFWD